MARERGLEVDMEGFRRRMESQKERSRAARVRVSSLPPDMDLPPTRFEGYESLRIEDAEVVWADEESLVVDRTVFYPEGGGQKGDRGVISGRDFLFAVEGTFREQGVIVHRGAYRRGGFPAPGEKAVLEVDAEVRRARERNHTATHLLHRVLRDMFGDAVRQQGSMVDAERFTFDFTFPRKLGAGEILAVEDGVNALIREALPVTFRYVSLEDARREGVIALFDEKYGETVRVVEIGDGVSRELCGGTHVRNTGEIEAFKLLAEEAVSAGNRRIEACTGPYVDAFREKTARVLEEIRDVLLERGFRIDPLPSPSGDPVSDARCVEEALDEVLRVTEASAATVVRAVRGLVETNVRLEREAGAREEEPPPEAAGIVQALAWLRDRNRRLEKERESRTRSDAAADVERIMSSAAEVNGILVAAGMVENPDKNYAQHVMRGLEKENPSGVCVVGTARGNTSAVSCSVGKEAAARGISAEALVKRIGREAGGGGGGSTSFARGGGGDPEKLGALLRRMNELIAEMMREGG